MKCKTAKKMISSHIDDELTPEDKEAFIRHIGECRKCRTLDEEIRTVHNLCIYAERYNAPRDLLGKIVANIEAGKAAGEWNFSLAGIPRFLKFVEVALALIIVFVGSLSGYILTMNGRGLERAPCIEECLFLDVFKATPPDSLGDAYIALMGGDYEK